MSNEMVPVGVHFWGSGNKFSELGWQASCSSVFIPFPIQLTQRLERTNVSALCIGFLQVDIDNVLANIKRILPSHDPKTVRNLIA